MARYQDAVQFVADEGDHDHNALEIALSTDVALIRHLWPRKTIRTITLDIVWARSSGPGRLRGARKMRQAHAALLLTREGYTQ